MKLNFVTPLLLGSALALGALGFVACGDDDSPVIPGQPGKLSSSSGVVEPPPETTPITSIRTDHFGINTSTLSRIKFKGDITLDFEDSTAISDFSAVHFTNLDVRVISKNGTSAGSFSMTNPLDFNAEFITSISLQGIGLQTNLDEGYSECGEFIIYVTATASDGVNPPSVSRDSIPFVRPEEKCIIPESSSSEAKVPGAPLDTISIEVNTKVDKCLNLATATVSASPTGDICFTRTGSGKVELSSSTGIKFSIYNNLSDYKENGKPDRTNDYSRDMLPTNPTTDDFLYVNSLLQDTYPDFIGAGDVFFVAIAPSYVPNTGSATGFYAFIVKEGMSTPDPNGDITFSLLLYKAK